MLVVRLLGGLMVTADDVEPGRPRGRCAALLAWLALHPGMQPRARVAARLWPDVLDESARRSLRTALLDLRAALGGAADGHLIGTRDEIGLGPDVRVDVRDFAAAVAAGRLEGALAIGAAGELLPELDQEWVVEARGEHELRLAEVIERLALEAEARGDTGAAVEHARRLVAMDPLCEEHARSLMRRLALADDRAAALTVFEQHRARLRTELRMAPSAATRALADDIREGHEVAGAAERRPVLPAPLALAAGAGPLVGREAELLELEAAWAAIADGVPRGCLLTGEAGIGKSRLTAELARRVVSVGAPVLYGACRESPRPPYGPFVEAISTDLRRLDRDAAVRRIGTGAGELARIVPDLGDRFGSAAPASADSPAGEQLRLFGAVGGYLERAAQPRVLVVLEDLHWADSGTLALLAHVVRTAAGGLLLVVTSRDVAPDVTPALSHALSDLGRHPAVRRIALRGLTEPDVMAFLRAAAGGAATDVAHTARLLHGATGGSPLFLREIVRELPADGLLQTVPVSSTVRDLVASRFALLPAAEGAMLDAAAVLGAEFEARTCAEVLDRPLPEVLDALDRACASGIVVSVPGAPARFAFTHAVVREVRYDAIPAGRRMRLHHTAGAVLRTAGAPVTELARHFYAAGDLGDPEDAFTYARRAGDLARDRLAFADAAVHFEQAARLAERLPGLSDRDRCDLAIDRGEALHRAGDPGHQAVLLGAAATARRLDDAELLTRAALALSERGWTIMSASLHEVVQVAREALDRLPPDAAASRARLMAMIAAAIHLTGGHEEGRDLGSRAVALARASGDLHVLAEVLISAHWACFDPLNLDVRLDWAHEACDLGERLRAPVVLGQTLRMLGQDHLESGDVAGARRAFDRADRIADELDAPFLRMFAAASGAALAALAGRLDDAERLADDCGALARRVGTITPFFARAGFTVSIERGQWEDAEVTVTAMSERMGLIGPLRAALAMLHARLGHVDEARPHLRHFLDTQFAGLPRVIHWGPGMVMLADAATWLRDADAAARIFELLEPTSGHTPWNAFTALWPNDVALAQLCVVLGDHPRAHAYLDAAEEACRRNDVPAHQVRVALHRAWALRDAGEPVDAGPVVAAANASACPGVAREARLMGLAG